MLQLQKWTQLIPLVCVAILFPKLTFANIQIIKRPITFDAKRKELTMRYMEQRYGMKTGSITIEPKMIVVHWTAMGDLNRCLRVFTPPTLASWRKELSASALNVSAHFLVDRDGAIYQLMPDQWMARHVIGLNHCAIGIENVGGEKGVEDLTPKQLESNTKLIFHLKKKYPQIAYLIGHYEYLKFEGSPLWKELPSTGRTIKQDPGPKFMEALRKNVQSAGLKKVP